MKYKRYKHSRKGLAELFFAYKDKCEFIKDLLAQKEDRKECKHIPDREVGLNVWSCKKCRCCFVHKPTPSPLEIEEVSELMDFGFNEAVTIKVKLINRIIRNQNQIISYLKQK
jgi:hypothetical protein